MFGLTRPTEEHEDELDDASLVDAAKGDPTHFDVLYQRYRRSIYRYLRARLWSDEDAADVCQHVFLKAIEALPTYKERGLPFSAWLFRIARNAAVDTRRRQRISVSWETVSEAEHPIDPMDPEQALLQLDSFERFEALLRPLDEEKRDLLILRFVVGMTSQEIAHVVGKTDMAVRAQLSRTIKSLKEHFYAE